jgi:hypothetical protein
MNSTQNFQMAPPSVSYFGSSGVQQSVNSQTVSNPVSSMSNTANTQNMSAEMNNL